MSSGTDTSDDRVTIDVSIENVDVDVVGATDEGREGMATSDQQAAQRARMVPDKEEDEIMNEGMVGGVITSKEKKESATRVNFASIGAGATVLETSGGAKGYMNLLNEDKDKYGISECSEKMWVVMSLSEDVMVNTIVLANYEKYRSVKKFIHIHIYPYIPIHTHTYSYMLIHTHTCSYILIYTHIYSCIYSYIFIYTHVYTHVYTNVYTPCIPIHMLMLMLMLI